MPDEIAIMILDVFQVGSGGTLETPVAWVEYYRDGRLALLDVQPAIEHDLRRMLDAVNVKPRIVELIPASRNGQTFAVATRVTERMSEDFLQALDRYMRLYYGFGLG